MRTVLALSALVLIAAGSLALAQTAASQQTITIEGGDDWFCDPSYDGGVCETSVTAGDTVTWVMVEGIHTVTECDSNFSACPVSGGFDSDVMSSGETFSHTFSTPGTFPYICLLHPSDMRGRITVVAAPTPTPSLPPSPTGHPGVMTPIGEETPPPVTPVSVPATGGAAGGQALGGAMLVIAAAGLIALAAGVLLIGVRRASR